MANTVTVACRLPMGLVLDDAQGNPAFELRGQNKARLFIEQTGYLPHMVGISQVPVDLWDAWKKAHADSALLKQKLVFEAKDEASAERMGLELAGEKTGFQQLNPEKEGVKPSGSDDK